jgi:hypothetical protein
MESVSAALSLPFPMSIHHLDRTVLLNNGDIPKGLPFFSGIIRQYSAFVQDLLCGIRFAGASFFWLAGLVGQPSQSGFATCEVQQSG